MLFSHPTIACVLRNGSYSRKLAPPAVRRFLVLLLFGFAFWHSHRRHCHGRYSPRLHHRLFSKVYSNTKLVFHEFRSCDALLFYKGIDPSIRAEVWPFLLGMIGYESLRKRCHQILKRIESENSSMVKELLETTAMKTSPTLLSSDSVLDGDTDKSAITCEDGSTGERESSDSDSSEELGNPPLFASEITEDNGIGEDENANSVAPGIKGQASVSETKAREIAESVCLKEYDHLEPCRIYHAARLVNGCGSFRRELNFEQTLCLWEVGADQAAIRAACVLQRRKQIIEMYGSMDEIMRECHSMAGQLDVWKLLDDAHDLVVNLREKI
ncbi:hypothetical protein F3Y22_tig00002890pilonHSYRG00028 [Hibiscus syriacus]|uniref:Rab-GAP TBC domain-containing protein n=1 Tax=Hibiscus syriacus TaxID=106335 RepID=A0A6A3CNG4_HIBSY|nr:hypothetical protein F3Y22_tig00002890pilonHSYRG00028 [Hibiscus syriacus]